MTWWQWLIVAWIAIQLPLGSMLGRLLRRSAEVQTIRIVYPDPNEEDGADATGPVPSP